MSEEKPQFDAFLGGAENLPSTISLSRFLQYRREEIKFMKNALIMQSGTKLAFQTLPKHMRRRTMSHNVKRLPRRLRQIHLNQMKKSGMPTKQKRPSRKFRRRPNNLTEEYLRRSNKNYKWLQTHIWHAKRFHMVEKWGYKLPHRPCDKAFRACYRATTQHCLLQDISYISCVQISGDKSVIVQGLNKLHRFGLSFGAKAFSSGRREGELTLYELEKETVIGTIVFNWMPGQDTKSKLWMWIHAAFYQLALDNIVRCLDLIKIEEFEYINENTKINLRELRRELSRLRLTGPLATAILQDAFVPLDFGKSDTTNTPWLDEHLANHRAAIESQFSYWKGIKDIGSVSEISPHLTLSLIVRDVRFNLPKKRVKCAPECRQELELALPDDCPNPLWEEHLRDAINENMISNDKISKLRSRLLVPGSNIEESGVFVPVILIQRPGSKTGNFGLCSGWDLVVPAVWTKAFWVSLIMRSCRSGGLREFDSTRFEMGKMELLPPDSQAGFDEEEYITKTYLEKFFKRPPNNRINYNKFAIVSPFSWNWKMLIRDWRPDSQSVENFQVLRDKILLKDIEILLKSKSRIVPKCPENCLIPVKLLCSRKGCPKPFSIICLCKSGADLKREPVEPNCADKYQAERKQTREAHKALLKKLKKRRKLKRTLALDQLHQEALTNYTKKMRSLWLPEATNLRNSCSREVIGLVKTGGFSLSQGNSCALGYITADALSALVNSPCRNRVLFRNTNSKQYRIAELKIVTE